MKRTLLVVAAVEVVVGLLHFVMPGQYQKSDGLGGLDGADADYVVLVTYAVGILLVTFGATTYLFAQRLAPHLDLVVPYLAIKTVLWTARSVIEVTYPVQLRMFGIEPFTALVLPGVVGQTVLFAAAWAMANRVRAGQSATVAPGAG